MKPPRRVSQQKYNALVLTLLLRIRNDTSYNGRVI
jgi:hypothetical protein